MGGFSSFQKRFGDATVANQTLQAIIDGNKPELYKLAKLFAPDNELIPVTRNWSIELGKNDASIPFDSRYFGTFFLTHNITRVGDSDNNYQVSRAFLYDASDVKVNLLNGFHGDDILPMRTVTFEYTGFATGLSLGHNFTQPEHSVHVSFIGFKLDVYVPDISTTTVINNSNSYVEVMGNVLYPKRTETFTGRVQDVGVIKVLDLKVFINGEIFQTNESFSFVQTENKEITIGNVPKYPLVIFNQSQLPFGFSSVSYPKIYPFYNYEYSEELELDKEIELTILDQPTNWQNGSLKYKISENGIETGIVYGNANPYKWITSGAKNISILPVDQILIVGTEVNDYEANVTIRYYQENGDSKIFNSLGGASFPFSFRVKPNEKIGIRHGSAENYDIYKLDIYLDEILIGTAPTLPDEYLEIELPDGLSNHNVLIKPVLI